MIDAALPSRRAGHRRLRIAAGAVALAFSAAAAGQVYKCVDGAGRVTYQQAPCPVGAKGGRVELFIENGAARGSSDEEEQWEITAQQHTVRVGMPKRFVQKSIGTARDMRPGRPNENATEVWSYPREGETLRIGFTSGAVTWQRLDPATGDPNGPERTRATILASLIKGQACGQMLGDAGNADIEEPVSLGTGEVARRYVYEPPEGSDRTRTIVLCVNGSVREIERVTP